MILNADSPLLPSCWAFFALRCGVISQPLQRLPSYWDFSDLGCGVSPHCWSSEVQLLLLALVLGYLLTATASDLGRGVSPLGRLPLLRHTTAW